MPKKRPTNSEATQFRSGEQAVVNGCKGGIASGKARKQKKELRKCLEILLEKEMTDKNGKEMTGAEALAAKLFAAALKEKDGTKLARLIEVLRDTAGQKPVEKVMIAEVDPDVVAEVERMVQESE